MASSAEVTRDIIVAAIQNGTLSRLNLTSSNKENNIATAESIVEAYNIIYKAVDNAHKL